MSDTPGISPLTPDPEDVRHSDEDDETIIGDADELSEEEDADPAPDKQRDDI